MCVATLLFPLVLAVLFVLYGANLCLLGFPSMVLKEVLFQCLGCLGDILLGSAVIFPLLHLTGVFPLSVGVSLGCWGSLVLLVCQLLGSVWLGLDLAGGAVLAPGQSFSPSRADLVPETKLKDALSCVSHFSVLSLTHSSKVLKEIDLFAFLVLIHSSKVLK